MLYENISKDLATKILNNEFKNTKKLPSEMELAKKYNTSKMTIRKSLSLLIDSGIIFSIPKSGYYINAIEDIKKFNSLTGNSLTFLNKQSKLHSNVISYDIIDIPLNLQNIFSSDVEKLIYIQRIRYLDGKLISLETVYLNYNLFLDFKKDYAKGSIYKYVHSKGYTIASNLKTLKASFASKNFLKYEPILKNEPLIEIENTGFLTTGEVFEYSISYNLNNEYSTIVKFNNVLRDV